MKRTFVKAFFGILLCLLLLLQVRLWVSEDGFGEMSQLESQVALQRHENEELKLRNDRLDAEIQDLKSGSSAVEERARSDLGLVAPDETFYVFGDSGPAQGGAEAE